MFNVRNEDTTAVATRRSSTATKLIHAAALAAMLVPLASVAVETSTIDIYCTSSTAPGSGGGSPCGGSYSPGGPTSHTWGFFTDTSDPLSLLFSVQISGTPTASFTLGVIDNVVAISSLGVPGGGTCIPTVSPTQCGLVNVFNNTPSVLPADMWDANGYLMTILWFPNANPLSQAQSFGGVLNQANTSIRKAEDFVNFVDTLTDSAFSAGSNPFSDPGLSGRGDGFSGFAPYTTPEPATLTLIGFGVSGLIYRARGRKRRS